MQVLIITYDLSQPGRNYEGLIQRIKAYQNWARLGGSSYLIYTASSVVSVRDNLKMAMDQNDSIFVSVVRAPGAWYNMSEQVSDWIRERMS